MTRARRARFAGQILAFRSNSTDGTCSRKDIAILMFIRVIAIDRACYLVAFFLIDNLKALFCLDERRRPYFTKYSRFLSRGHHTTVL